MCELLTFLWSGRQNVSDSFFFSLLLTRRQCFWLESFHLRSKTWRLTFSSDCRRITAVHLYFFFWYTHTQVKLNTLNTCVCVQQYLRGSVCAHMECLRPHKCRPEEDLVDFILDLQLSTKDSNRKAFRSAALEEHRPHKNLSPVNPCRVCWIKTHDR